MNTLFPLALISVALAVSGCKSAEDYAVNNSATAGWLDSHAGRPAVVVAGRWHSENWGDGDFKQSGNRVTGILDKYPVGGVLDGRTLYLAITEDGWTSYTAILIAQPDGSLLGNSCKSVPFSLSDQSPIHLTRPAR